MRIAQLVYNLHRVFSASNNAIYGHVGYLCDRLADSGHEVTLFASGNSETRAKLESVYRTSFNLANKLSERERRHYNHLLISKCYNQARNFDLIHTHFTLLSSYYSGLVDIPTLISIHSPIIKEIKPFLKAFRNNYYVSFSLAQRKQMPDLNWFANIYHGVDTKKFSFNPKPKDYFLYLGRITEEKGVHLAIAAAKAAEVPLIIAGGSYSSESYWHEEIEKNIDGTNIMYVGEANLEQKIKYLRNAKAVLFPTQYNEVFGLVMIEAMACGTPVIAWRNGSVPEVIKHRKNGYIVKSVDDMVKAIKMIDKISRQETRKRAEDFFSIEKMVAGYEKVYARIIEDNYKNKNHQNNNEILPVSQNIPLINE